MLSHPPRLHNLTALQPIGTDTTCPLTLGYHQSMQPLLTPFWLLHTLLTLKVLTHTPVVRTHTPVVRTHTPVVLTHTPVVLTHTPVVLTHTPVVLTHTPVVLSCHRHSHR